MASSLNDVLKQAKKAATTAVKQAQQNVSRQQTSFEPEKFSPQKFTTQQVSSPQTAYQMNLSAPTKGSTWYSGSTPTASESLARIYQIAQTDPKKAESLYNGFRQFQMDPSNPYYNPYMRSTNQAVYELQKLGYNLSGGVTQNWLQENSYLMNYYRTGTGGTPLAPSKKSSKEQNAAYWYYKLLQAEDKTQKAETEWKALQEEIGYWAGRKDRNYSDDEILAKINWDNYKTLTSMEQDARDGVPVTLNRGIGYSRDNLKGAIWAARNGGSTGNAEMDAINAVLGRGNGWKEDKTVTQKLDPTSPYYSPYSVGSTIDNVALYFNRDSFDQDWLDNNRAVLASNDQTAISNYQKVYRAEQTTRQAENELEGLWKEVDRIMEYTTDPDKVIDKIKTSEDYKTLRKMDESLRSGDLLETTRAIDYRWEDVEDEIRKRCMTYNALPSGQEFAEKVMKKLGLGNKLTSSGKAVAEATNNRINAMGDIIGGYGTPEEKIVFSKAFDGDFDKIVDTLAGAIDSGEMTAESAYALMRQAADKDASNRYLDAAAVTSKVQKLQAEREKENAELVGLRALKEQGTDAALQFAGGNIDKMIAGLEAVVADYDSQIAALEEEARAAQTTMDSVKHNYDMAAKVYEMMGYGELDPETSMVNVLNTVQQLGGEYTPPSWAPGEELLAAMDQGGASYEQTLAAAKAGRQQNKLTLDAISTVLQRMKDSDIDLPEEYQRNLEVMEKDLRNRIQATDYFELRSNKDYDLLGTTTATKILRAWNDVNEGKALPIASIGNILGTEEYAPDGYNWLDNHIAAHLLGRQTVYDGTDRYGTQDQIDAMSTYECMNYLYLREKEGADAAKEYFNFLRSDEHGILQKRIYGNLLDWASQFQEEHPVAANFLSVAMSPMQLSGVRYTGQVWLNNLLANFGIGEEQTLNPYNAAFAMGGMQSEIRQNTKQDITDTFGEGTWGTKIANFGYDVAIAMADSQFNAALFGFQLDAGEGASAAKKFASSAIGSFVSASPMGAYSAASTIQQNLLKGATPEQAYLMGGISFLAETGSEAIEMEAIMDSFAKGASKEAAVTVKELVGDMLKSGFNEAIGESASELITGLSEEAILGSLSDYQKNVDAYLRSGDYATREEAEKAARKDFLMDVLYAGATGFASGAGGSVTGYAAGKISTQMDVNALASKYRAAHPGVSKKAARAVARQTLEILNQAREAVSEAQEARANAESTPTNVETGAPGSTPTSVETGTPQAPETAETTQTDVETAPAPMTGKERSARAVTVLTQALDADESSQSAAISAALIPESATPAQKRMATTAAQHLMDRYGRDNAVMIMRDILVRAEEKGMSLDSVQTAVTVAALISPETEAELRQKAVQPDVEQAIAEDTTERSIAQIAADTQAQAEETRTDRSVGEILTEIAQNVVDLVYDAGNVEGLTDVEDLVDAVERIQNDPDVTDQINTTIVDNMVATRTKQLVGEGAMDNIQVLETQYENAKYRRSKAESALSNEQQKLDAMSDSMLSAQAEYNGDPTQEAALTQAISDVEGQEKVVAEYEQRLENAKQDEIDAKNKFDAEYDRAHAEVVAQAQQDVTQQLEQEAAEQNAADYANALEAGHPHIAFGDFVTVMTAKGTPLKITGIKYIDQNNVAYFTTADGKTVSQNYLDPNMIDYLLKTQHDAMSQASNYLGNYGVFPKQPAVAFPVSLDATDNATGEIVQIVGLAKSYKGQPLNYVTQTGEIVTTNDITPVSTGNFYNVVAQAYYEHEDELTGGNSEPQTVGTPAVDTSSVVVPFSKNIEAIVKDTGEVIEVIGYAHSEVGEPANLVTSNGDVITNTKLTFNNMDDFYNILIPAFADNTSLIQGTGSTPTDVNTDQDSGSTPASANTAKWYGNPTLKFTAPISAINDETGESILLKGVAYMDNDGTAYVVDMDGNILSEDDVGISGAALTMYNNYFDPNSDQYNKLGDAYDQWMMAQAQAQTQPEPPPDGKKKVKAQKGKEMMLFEWQDPKLHGDVKKPKKGSIKTKAFKNWFNDPTDEHLLSNPDGTPKIFYRGFGHYGSKLYINHESPSGTKGVYKNFYSNKLEVSETYAGTDKILSLYDMANWETAKEAMADIGYELVEAENPNIPGQWGYQLKNKYGSNIKWYGENELNKFKKNYGGNLQAEGVFAGYISCKNPLVLDAGGRTFGDVPGDITAPDGATKSEMTSTDDWAIWAFKHGYDAVIVKHVRDNMSPGMSNPIGTDVITSQSSMFKSIYNVGKWNTKKSNILYKLPGIFSHTGQPISKQTQTVLDTLKQGKPVDRATIENLPEVQWAKAHEKKGTSIPWAENDRHYTAEEMDQLVDEERRQTQQDIENDLMALGSYNGVDTDGEALYDGEVEQGRTLDIVMGPPASGKSSALVNPLSQEHHARVLDSDMVKEALPEYENGLGAGYLHPESRWIWENAYIRATENGDNIVLPVVGGNLSSTLDLIKDAINNGYKVNLHMVEVDGAKTLGRALDRFLSDGRYIPPEYLMGKNASLENIRNNFNALKGEINGEYSQWNNDVPKGSKPILTGGSGSSQSVLGTGYELGGTAGNSETRPQSTRGKTIRNVKSPYRIAKRLARQLGIGDYIGTRKMNNLPKAVAGYYQQQSDHIGVRSSYAGDYSTTMHEIGHALAARLNMTGNSQMVNALPSLFASSYSADQLPGEAFAEWFWQYANDPEQGRAIAGDDFVDTFERNLQKSKLAKPVNRAIADLRAYLEATDLERVASTIRNASDKDRIALGERFRRAIDAHLDATNAAEAVNHQIRVQSGQNKVDMSVDVRSNALMMNFAAKRAEGVLTQALTNAMGTRRIGKSLAERWADVKFKGTDQNIKALESYMKALHNIDRTKQGKAMMDNVTIDSNKAIQEAIAICPEVVEAEKAFQEFRKDFMQAFLVDTGYISQAAFDRLNEMYPHYIPGTKVLDERFGRQVNKAGDFTIREAHNATQDTVSFIDSFTGMVNQIVAMNARNNTALAFDRAYQNYDMGEFARRVTPDVKTDTVSTEKLIETLTEKHDNGELDMRDDVFDELLATIGDDLSRTYTVNGVAMPQILRVQRADGSVAFYEMQDSELYKLLSGAQPTMDLPAIFQGIGVATKTMSMLTTGSDPAFAFRNFLRDFQTSVNWGSWASNYVTGFAKWARAAYDVWNGKGEYLDYLALGGGGFNMVQPQTAKGAEELRGSLFRGYNTRNIGSVGKMAGKAIWNTVTLNKLQETIEQTSRYAEYKYGKHDLSTDAGRMEAFLAGQEATVDFARRGNGNIVPIMSKLVPFFSASAQGVYRTSRIFSEAERRRAPVRIAKNIINTSLTSALSYGLLKKFLDKDEQEEFIRLSPGLKSTHFYLPNFAPETFGPEPLIRIPIAQDPATYLINGLVQDALWNGSDNEMAIGSAAIANAILDNLNPMGGGTIFHAYLDAKMNQTHFGSRIVPTRLLDRSPTLQYADDTPQLFIDVARWLPGNGVSPMVLEYLAEQYTGFLGKTVLPAISRDNNGEMAGIDASIRKLQKRFTSDPLVSNEVVNTFYDGYNLLKQIKKAGDDGMPMNDLRRGLTVDEAEQAYIDAKNLLSTNGAIAQHVKVISGYMSDIGDINKMDNLSAEEKYKLTSDIRRQMVEETMAVNEILGAYEEKYVKGPNLVVDWFQRRQQAGTVFDPADATAKSTWNDVDSTFKADTGKTYMQRAQAVWQASGNKSALPHPNASFTATPKGGSSTKYEIDRAHWDDYVTEYKAAYEDYVNDLIDWDTMTDGQRLEELKKAHTKGHNAAVKWYKNYILPDVNFK